MNKMMGGFHLKAGGAYKLLWCEAFNLLSAAKYSIRLSFGDSAWNLSRNADKTCKKQRRQLPSYGGDRSRGISAALY
jgi:hypothetical protein